MKQLFLYFLLLPVSFLFSNNMNESNEKNILINKILLVSSYSDLQDIIPKDMEVVAVKNLNLPGPNKDLLLKLVPIFKNKPLSQDLLVNIKKVISEFYQVHNHPFVTILIPEQEIISGVLQLVVIEGKVGEIKVQNNKYIPSEKILRSINLQSNDPINLHSLLTDISWINHNPFQNANLMFQQGKQENTTDINIMIKDRFPLKVYTGADNSGSQFSGLNRWYAGFNWGNIFYENQILSYQFNSSFDFKKFISHTLSYSLYTFFHHSLSIFGGYAKVYPELPGLKSTGKSTQISIRYKIPFEELYKSFQNGMTFGFDYKSTNNNVATAEKANQIKISNKASLSQFIFNYFLSLDLLNYKAYFSGNCFISPFTWMKHQKTLYYNAIRSRAKPKYLYFNILFDQEILLPKKFKVTAKFQGQLAFVNLLPSELFDLGGQNTVRGYENRLINREQAICINLEIFSPPINLLSNLNKNAKDYFNILAFIDFGYAQEYKKTASYTGDKSLLGTGLGLRYYINNNLSVKFDWGYPIFKVLGENSSKLYFHGNLSF